MSVVRTVVGGYRNAILPPLSTYFSGWGFPPRGPHPWCELNGHSSENAAEWPVTLVRKKLRRNF